MNGKSYALRLLKNRLRSVWEIDQALLKRKVEAEDRDKIIVELLEIGLLNDERFALSWIHTRDRLSPRGDFLLVQELRQRGIAKEVIDTAMQRRKAEQHDETNMNPTRDDILEEMAGKVKRMYGGLPEEVRRRRAAGFLARRGFSTDEVVRILNA